MICFVVLHYMVEEETIGCIESIKNTITEEKKIVVVDNASPNGSGERLKTKYMYDKEIIILLNKNNDGFARGNNLGYKYIKQNLESDFIVIMNNDVEIKDSKFVKKIYSIYDDERFYVLGPDIYSTAYDIHQSPKRLCGYTIEEVEEINKKYLKSMEMNFIFYIKCFLKKSNFLREIIYKKRRKKIDYSKKYYNVPLHGACLIFSKDYIEQYANAFFDKTFFYYECEILDYICRVDNRKTVYSPDIKVEHHQNISTNVVYKNIIQKTLFANKCNYESTLAFLNYMKSK